MAKADKAAAQTAPEETVIETPAIETPTAQPTKKTEAKREVELLYGQCIIAPVGKPETEILVTINDWDSVYNAGENKGKFTLLAEKKS